MWVMCDFELEFIDYFASAPSKVNNEADKLATEMIDRSKTTTA